MKPLTPRDPRHDAFDDLIAAALHGELTPEERTQFDARLSSDPAAQAAYQEAQAMHDLLDKTHRSAQPDPDFEQRIVSGVRRKLAHPPLEETAWESLVILWTGTKAFFTWERKPLFRIPGALPALAILGIIAVLAGVALGPITNGIAKAKQSADVQAAHAMEVAEYQAQVDAGVQNPDEPKGVRATPDGRIVAYADDNEAKSAVDITDKVKAFEKTGELPGAGESDLKKVIHQQGIDYTRTAQSGVTLSGYVDTSPTGQFGGTGGIAKTGDFNFAHKPAGTASVTVGGANTYAGGTTISGGATTFATVNTASAPAQSAVNSGPIAIASGGLVNAAPTADLDAAMPAASTSAPTQTQAPASPPPAEVNAAPMTVTAPVAKAADAAESAPAGQSFAAVNEQLDVTKDELRADNTSVSKALAPATATAWDVNWKKPATAAAELADTRKLIRNAQLDLEVKSYQAAFDQISALTKSAGGYVDTSSSQRGGNGKLQGTVVVKILPENLDVFLLKLRDLGVVQNQSVSTDDVTKDYYDTQARLVNAQKMEEQLQDLLKRENGKVADLLAVERELGRVRGNIEEMQGQLKLYDFQVQYATVTMNLAEKDLNQAAAYLLKEQDAFSLYATDVESAFQKARATADKFNAQVLAANLEHDVNSDNNQVAASLVVMVAPEQIEPFLAEVRGLGRVANFTRQTERVAKDGGDSSQPADETKTEKDKVRVQLSINSDNDSRKQVGLTVVTKDVDSALDAAKAAALANAGTEILGSSLNTTPQGESTGQLTVRVPGKAYATLLEAYRALGRQAAMSVQRNDNNGPGASGDDVPVILSLALSDNDTPVQTTNLALITDDVDAQAQQIKKQAGEAGVEIKSSSFQRQPDGTEQAQLTLRLPLGKYPAFLATLEKAGKVDALSVQRDDRPDQAAADDAAPAEIQLQLTNPPAIVPDNGGLWATLRNTFGEGFAALFGSIRVIGVAIAFLAPWVVMLILCAWIARRIYVWRKR